MVACDPALATLRLDGRELAAATLAVVDPADPTLRHPDVQELLHSIRTEAGGEGPGAVAPFLAGLVTVVHRPQLRLVVEVFRASPAVAATVWATPDLAVVARPAGGDVLEYTTGAPMSLPFTLASLVGLGSGAPAGGREDPSTVAVAVDALDAADQLLVGGARTEARSALIAGGLDGRNAAAVVDVLAHRQATWRLSSAWMDTAGELHAQVLTLVDAGPSGLWTTDAGPAGLDGGSVPAGGADPPVGVVTLTRVSPADAWHALIALLPVAPLEGGPDVRSGKSGARQPVQWRV